MAFLSCALIFACAVAAFAAAHGPSGATPSLSGLHTRNDVRALNAALAASPPALALEPTTVLTASRRGTGASHPSGLATVDVAWEGVSAHPDDVIVLRCALGGPPGVGEYWEASTTSGSFVAVLPHGIGCTFELALLRRSTGGATIVATSGAITLGADTDAVGTRLSYGDAPGDVLLTWASLNATAFATVRVGTTPGGPYPLLFTAAPPTTYAAADLCHAPANETFITSTATRYYAVYGQVGGADAPEISFRTRPPVGPDVVTRFAAFGDSATYPVFPGTVTTFDLILALDREGEGLDFAAIIGDLAYAEGSVLVWSLWQGLAYPLSSALPFLVTVGNHETNVQSCSATANPIAQQGLWQGPVPVAEGAYGDDCGGEGGYATYVRYRSPSNGQGVHWYSFDAGSVHFVHWSSEHDYTPGSAQRAWLEKDLMGVDRTITPWVVAAMHRPAYNPRDDGDWVFDVAMTASLEPLFLSAKVNLFLSGHYHNYLRTHPMREMAVDVSGAAPIYITVGTGGATYHAELLRNDTASWMAAEAAEWGFGVVEALNRSTLRWTFRANAAGGEVRDEAFISNYAL